MHLRNTKDKTEQTEIYVPWTSHRSCRHQVAAASHIFVKSESVILMRLSHSRQSYSCRLKSVIFVVAVATSKNCNEWATKIKTKFVSLIAKLQNKTVVGFTVSLCLPVLRYNRTTMWHALLFGIYGNIGTSCHPYKLV